MAIVIDLSTGVVVTPERPSDQGPDVSGKDTVFWGFATDSLFALAKRAMNGALEQIRMAQRTNEFEIFLKAHSQSCTAQEWSALEGTGQHPVLDAFSRSADV